MGTCDSCEVGSLGTCDSSEVGSLGTCDIAEVGSLGTCDSCEVVFGKYHVPLNLTSRKVGSLQTKY